MKRNLIAVSAAVAVALTVLSGLIQGRMSGRWGSSHDLIAIGSRLNDVPENFGDWTLKSSGKLGEVVEEILQCKGSIVRTYFNRKTGRSVNLAVTMGPSGPISVHTPEVCYSSQAFDKSSQRRRIQIETPQGESNELWMNTFRSTDVNAQSLQVCYGWSTGDRWCAPEQPRFSFGASPFLYKIQIASRLEESGDEQEVTAYESFLREFLPVLGKHLGPIPQQDTDTTQQ